MRFMSTHDTSEFCEVNASDYMILHLEYFQMRFGSGFLLHFVARYDNFPPN